MGRAVVVFRGSRNERLGEGDNLFGKGAVLADVTVYGPKGEDDIGRYKGYTMSSNPEKFGVVADGEYEVNKLIPGKREPLPSNWALNKAKRVPAMDNFNPAYDERIPGYLEGVYIHRSNLSGYAGITSSGGGISEGCLLFAPYQYTNGVNDWDRFNKQLKSLDRFLMILNR